MPLQVALLPRFDDRAPLLALFGGFSPADRAGVPFRHVSLTAHCDAASIVHRSITMKPSSEAPPSFRQGQYACGGLANRGGVSRGSSGSTASPARRASIYRHEARRMSASSAVEALAVAAGFERHDDAWQLAGTLTAPRRPRNADRTRTRKNPQRVKNPEDQPLENTEDNEMGTLTAH